MGKDNKSKPNIVRSVGRKLYRLTLFVFIILGSAVSIFAFTELLIGTIGYLRTRAVYRDANRRFVSVHAKEPVSANKTEPAPVVGLSENTVSEDKAEPDPFEEIQVDLKALREINDEVIGWIYFEDGLISYPILYSGDNEKYLKRNYMEKYMASGSIFMDKTGNPDFSDHYTLLYGHNMRDLTMFGKLRYYRSDKNYYKDHEYFQIITEDAAYRYRVFSFKQISVDSGIFSSISGNEAGLKEFADKKLIPGNNVNTDTTIKDSDHVLALSTCVNDYAYRFIVCGVRVDTKPLDGSTSVSSGNAGAGVSSNKTASGESAAGNGEKKDPNKKSTSSGNRSASGNKAVIVDVDP